MVSSSVLWQHPREGTLELSLSSLSSPAEDNSGTGVLSVVLSEVGTRALDLDRDLVGVMSTSPYLIMEFYLLPCKKEKVSNFQV